jgi:hypothetical protein
VVVEGEFDMCAGETGAGQEDKCPLIEANAKDSNTVGGGFRCSCTAF